MEQINVCFERSPKSFDYISPIKVDVGDFVVVQSQFGLEIAKVISKSSTINTEIKIERIATKMDVEQNNKNKIKAKNFLTIAKEEVKKLNLEMKMFHSILTLDGKKIVIFFTADNRVNFRELVKILAGIFKRKIELHQVGSRDELQITKSMGICGKTCCCGSFLSNFNHVTIKMAKQQGISLLPNNITGNCGKLLCCLEYENSVYLNTIKLMPKIGSEILTPIGTGKVLFNNIVKKTVDVCVKDENKTFELDILLKLNKKDKHDE